MLSMAPSPFSLTMTARSPPTRPHIGTPSFEQSQSIDSWGDDDAWDSGSDEEEPPKSKTRPKPVPISKPAFNSSSSTLSFSYINAPSSYPPKNGWTIVRGEEPKENEKQEAEIDADVEGDMVLELDLDSTESKPPPSRQSSVREDADEIVKDPLYSIRQRALRSEAAKKDDGAHEKSERLMRERSIRTNRKHKFTDCLSGGDVNVAELRKLAWAGIPDDLRPIAWQLLLGYLPLHTQSRSSTLVRKREEYRSMVDVTFAKDRQGLDQQIWHQIEIDVPRTRPGVQLWMYGATQRSLERILYVWAIRHPASGYVQGINDLVTPFFQVFLSAYIDTDPEAFDPGLLPTHILDAIEADSFWCLSRLLDGIQDNYIFAQPGIQRSVRRMAELVARIDAPLAAHLESQNVEFMQFAFRWMNCLLMREISVRNTIRMWDTYLAEGTDAFSQFHLYVCSAFLVKWSEKLRQMDFQGIIMFLQSLPTQGWGDHEIEMLLSEAFVLNSIWHNAQSHFTGK